MKAKFLREGWSGGPIGIKGINERLIIEDIICAIFDEDKIYNITIDGRKKYGTHCDKIIEISIYKMKNLNFWDQFWTQDYFIGGGYYFVNNEVEIEINLEITH